MQQLLGGNLEDIEFVVTPGENTWYSLVIEDAAGRVAYTNPVWVNTIEDSGGD